MTDELPAKPGKSRRGKKRKSIKEELLTLLSDGQAQSEMCLALIQEAQGGNIKAFEVVRDAIGERRDEPVPQDSVKLILERRHADDPDS